MTGTASAIRWSRAEGGRFRVALPRGDGAASDLADSAPAELSGFRAASECRLGSSCVLRPAWDDRASLRAHAERTVSDREMAAAAYRFLYSPPATKEAWLYRAMFAEHGSGVRIAPLEPLFPKQ